MHNKILAFDLDDVICVRTKDREHLGVNKYNHSTPIQPTIDIINRAYAHNKIVIYTARGMRQFHGDVNKVYANLYHLTKDQLDKWGVKYDDLIMGKMHYDMLIDDKAVSSFTIKTIEDLEEIVDV